MQQQPHQPSRPVLPLLHVAPVQHRITDLLALADVQVDGDRPWDMQVHDNGVFGRLLAQGSLGLGDSYMDGAWDTDDLDGLLFRLLDARLDDKVPGIAAALDSLRARVLNLQAPARADHVARQHYDLGNDLYLAMLGPRMIYSCAYWRGADGHVAVGLEAAREAKLDLVCRKLGLRPGMRVLDVGCGWGGALAFAAERYGVSGVGVTISGEQAAYARDYCRGLPVEIRLQDYRELHERFDAIMSIGMFEHVGALNYREYFEVARRCLRDEGPDGGGLFLLHCIGCNAGPSRPDPWISRYIFPNSMIPAMSQVAEALEGLFVVEDWHNFGADYDRTLSAWQANFDAAWPTLSQRYDERFRRMWHYYLGVSTAVFRSRRDQLWQLTLSPHGVPGGYRVPR
jgi:cyclopropane-fatty-acyl-phospholipid synthase